MTKHRRNVRAALTVLATVIVIAAAAVVWQRLPVRTQVHGPFDVHGTSGEAVTGRAIAATVHGARVAPAVTAELLGRMKRVPAVGRWVVVDVTLDAVRETVLPKADLSVGGNIYNPSDRFLFQNLGSNLDPGIPMRATLAFDVAPELLDNDAPLVLLVRGGLVDHPLLDSRLVIAINKRDITATNVVMLDRPRLGA